MYCTYIIGKFVKFKGDAITLYIGNFNRNFKNGHLIGRCRFSVKMFAFKQGNYAHSLVVLRYTFHDWRCIL